MSEKLDIGRCGKLRYESRGEAQAAIGRLRAHRGNDGRKAKAYHCQWCDGWHWGREWKNWVRRDRR